MHIILYLLILLPLSEETTKFLDYNVNIKAWSHLKFSGKSHKVENTVCGWKIVGIQLQTGDCIRLEFPYSFFSFFAFNKFT